MGEREGDDARPDHRATRPDPERTDPAAPGAPGPGPCGPSGARDIGAVLAAALREGAVDPDAENRAVAAFRAARDEGAAPGGARGRRQDDWRPAAERRRGRPLRGTLVALAASVTLGGVAVAAIGSGMGTRDDGDEPDGPRPSSSVSAAAGAGGADAGLPGSPGPSASGSADASPDASPDGSSAGQDTLAHCRAYDSVEKRGKVLDSAAWQRLVRAAGGQDEVGAYCAARLTGAEEKTKGQPQSKDSSAEKSAKSEEKSAEKSAKSAEKSAKSEEKAEKKSEKKNADEAGPDKPPKASKPSGQGATKSARSQQNAERTKGAEDKAKEKSRDD